MCPSDMGNLSRCWLFCLGGVPCVLQTWVTLADAGYSVYEVYHVSFRHG